MPAGSTIPESARPKAKSRYSKVFKSFFHRSSRSRSEEIPTKASDQVASPIAVSTTTSDPPSALSATDNINTIPRDVYQQLLPPSLTAPQQSQPGPVKKLTTLGNAGWEIMRQTLNITKELSDGFPPLKGAVTGVLFVIEYIEKVNDVQTDFGELAAMIAALNNVLGHYHNTEAELPSSVRTRLEQFIGAINLQNGAIQEKIRRGVFKRTLEAGDDTQEIVKMLRTLTAMTNLFGIDTALNTDINVEKIRFQIGTLLDETKKSGNLPVNLNDTLLPVQAALCDPDGFPEEYKHCLRGTRETTLVNATEDIQKALQSTAKQKFWLTGVAGSGKSTLATSLVIALRAQGVTVATFFCKRDQVDRRDPRRVIPTLAWYLATRFPEFRKSLDPELREILAGRKALPSHPAAQLESLLLRPLNHLSTLPKPPPIVILIDALDESDEVSRHLLIDALIEETATFPEQVAVVLVSRKSRDLQRKLQSLPLLLDLDRHRHDPAADHDIHLYLEDRLRDIRDQQQEEASWPSELEVSNLTERAEGLFIWAVIACNFIEQPSCREELSRLLSQTGVTVGIDDLYAYTLGSEFSKMRGKTAWVEDYRSVMGCIICSLSPLSPGDIACLIGRSLPVVKATLNILQPLLYYDESGHVRLVHASLADYLIEEERSQQLWVANQYLHLSLARGCLKVLVECSAGLNVDFETSFVHLYHEAILPHMQYSSISWADHLVLAIFADSETLQIAELIKGFLTSSFLVWLEMLSRLESVSKGVHALRLLVSWTKTRELELQNLAVDSCRFLETFRVPIQTEVYHLYLSALPWAPSGSLIANIYRKKLDPQGVKLPAIHAGLPTEWPKDYTFESEDLEERPEEPTDTSPPESIETNRSDPSNEDFVIMELERFHLKGLLVFSPDGTLVALASKKKLCVWDTRLGTVFLGPFLHSLPIGAVEISPDNKLIAVVSVNHKNGTVEVSVFSLDPFAGKPSLHSEPCPRIFHRTDININGHKLRDRKDSEKIIEFSEDSTLLKIISHESSSSSESDVASKVETWDIQSGKVAEDGTAHTFTSSHDQTVAFEHGTGWLIHKQLNNALCFIPSYHSQHYLSLLTFQDQYPSAFHASSGKAALFVNENLVLIQIPVEWRRIIAISEADMGLQQPWKERISDSEAATSSSSSSSEVALFINPPPLFLLAEEDITQRYQSVLDHMGFLDLFEDFLSRTSAVGFFCEEPVSLPFVQVHVDNLPSNIVHTVYQQDKGEKGERQKVGFVPIQDPNKADGTIHFWLIGQRGFWPVYVVFNTKPVYLLAHTSEAGFARGSTRPTANHVVKLPVRSYDLPDFLIGIKRVPVSGWETGTFHSSPAKFTDNGAGYLHQEDALQPPGFTKSHGKDGEIEEGNGEGEGDYDIEISLPSPFSNLTMKT